MRKATTILLAAGLAVALATTGVLATGARAQMDGTAFKSINSSGDTVAQLDGNGLTLFGGTSYDDSDRAIKWSSTRGRITYVTDGYLNNGTMAFQAENSPTTYDFLKVDSGTGTVDWRWRMADLGSGATAFFPYTTGSSSIGTVANPVGDIYGGIFHSKIGATTFDGTTEDCGSGASSITVKGGLVTSVSCASPAPASELASLRSTIAAQNARIAALEAALQVRPAADRPAPRR